MLNFEKESKIDVKALVKKFKPLILFLIVFIFAWIVFINYYLDNQSAQIDIGNIGSSTDQSFERIINLINSDNFDNLIYTPNPESFNEVPLEKIDVLIFNNNPNPFGN